jgi:hypothetical protein
MAFSQAGMDIIGKDTLDEHSLLEESAKNNHLTLTPGPRLHELNRRATSKISQSLDDLNQGQGPKVIKIHEWISRTIIMTSTETMYGPQNPFRNPANVGVWQ